MKQTTGAGVLLVQPWLVTLALVIAGAYAIGMTSDAPLSGAAKLDPPAGLITGTMKTLDEIEPRTPIAARFVEGSTGATFEINEPGSYFLPESIEAGAGMVALHIRAAPVTIDLMGHIIEGASASSDLILVDALSERVVIRNGVLRRSGDAGVRSFASSLVLEDLEVSGTRGPAFTLDSDGRVTLRSCTLRFAGTGAGIDRSGITLTGPCFVRAERLEIQYTGGYGVFAGEGTRLTMEDSVVADTGSDGVRTSEKNILRRLRVERTNGHGVSLADDARLEDSDIDDSAGNGVEVGDRCSVENNRIFATVSRAPSLGAGIMVLGDDSIVKRNTITGGGDSYFGVRLSGARNLLSCNRVFDNAGFSTVSGNMVGNILTSVPSWNANQDPDANYDGG